MSRSSLDRSEERRPRESSSSVSSVRRSIDGVEERTPSRGSYFVRRSVDRSEEHTPSRDSVSGVSVSASVSGSSGATVIFLLVIDT